MAFSCTPRPSSPASVAELGSVRPSSFAGGSSEASLFRFACTDGESFPVPVAGGTPLPTSRQHPPVPARAISSDRPSFRYIARFVHAFPAAAPSFPRRSPRWFLRRSRGPSVGGRPNHALQRTGHGGGGFLRSQPLRRHGPSLSLSPLGPESLPGCSSRAGVFPFLHRLACSRSLCQPVHPSGTLVFSFGLSRRQRPHSPAGVHVGIRSSAL